MQGTVKIPFSSLFIDTVRAHGVAFAHKHYVVKGKMPRTEFNIWLNLL